MAKDKILYVVHCIDTEGPLDEKLTDTFKRLKMIFGIDLEPTQENLLKLQNKEVNLAGKEEAVAKCLSPELLNYNRTWEDIDRMLDEVLSENFRNQVPDSFGGGWIYSWHCMDHIGVISNPRNKDIGYGKIFRHYRNRLNEGNYLDEINWHFHPLSLSRESTHAATSYTNNFDVLNQILCKRVIEDNWFPVVNRPGFHSERSDSHLFMEQWIPFDFANQQTNQSDPDQPDLADGRLGDWRRSPRTWRGYHPAHHDYQLPGNCNRTIFRCLNLGTRVRILTIDHVREAFEEASYSGSAILAFANHDWRDIAPDVRTLQMLLEQVKPEFTEIKIKYSGAERAAREILSYVNKPELSIGLELKGNRAIVKVLSGEIFGPQPYLAIESREGLFFHDNLDEHKYPSEWSYTFDDQTIDISLVKRIGVGSAGKYGGFATSVIQV
jgi:hypothetical protein